MGYGPSWCTVFCRSISEFPFFFSVQCPDAYLFFNSGNGLDRFVVNTRSKSSNFLRVKNDLMKLQAVCRGTRSYALMLLTGLSKGVNSVTLVSGLLFCQSCNLLFEIYFLPILKLKYYLNTNIQKIHAVV